MSTSFDKDTPVGWQAEHRQRSVIKQGFERMADYLNAQSDNYRKDLMTIHKSGLTSLDTDNCLGASPGNGLRMAWLELVEPIAEFTKDEGERKFLLSQALGLAYMEATKEFGKFSTPDLTPDPIRY